jgi:hypothetical protein
MGKSQSIGGKIEVRTEVPKLVFKMMKVCEKHYTLNCENCPFRVPYILHTFGMATVKLDNNTACDHVRKIITAVFNDLDNIDYGIVEMPKKSRYLASPYGTLDNRDNNGVNPPESPQADNQNHKPLQK